MVPDRYPQRYGWPIPHSECSLRLRLARQGDVGVLLSPAKDGFVDYGPFLWDLWAFRVYFDCADGLVFFFLKNGREKRGK